MKLLDDPFLAPFAEAIRGRAQRADERLDALTQGRIPLVDWANAHHYFGLHRASAASGTWTFREYLPGATAVWLVGDFNQWRTDPRYQLQRSAETGVWSRTWGRTAFRHGQRYHLVVEWDQGGGRGERIPAFARYVLQDPETKLFEAVVWEPKIAYRWRHPLPVRLKKGATPLIYEAHVGMATEEERVGTYVEFRDRILPRIKAAGYNTVQLMGVMEHPYYGSFGYHVSSFFAASSRFGTPDELKSLVDAAHGLGLRVIMDIVHSHAVKNERDGLSRQDGTDYLYFHSGGRGLHPAWDSRCFDYGKTETLHLLLSNCKFWLEEYKFDGYRFDGITSMLFYDHGLGSAYVNYDMYFNGSVDDDAWVYLRLANQVIHAFKPSAITIAEDVSGMPGVAAPLDDYGLGFDYRMAMGEPDFWFRLAAEVRDEAWPMGGMFYELTNRRAEEKVVSYVESHDQALVGGKTFFFQLADAAIYWGMRLDQHGIEIERAIALHKLARLVTAALNGGAYLNFMGNEFGHPEWIDFPRAENGWSYHHARRQWTLRDDPGLRFKALADFDEIMLKAIRQLPGERPFRLAADDGDQVLAFVRGDYLFAFNFNPERSFTDYGILVPPATKWRLEFDTDEVRFGGQGRLRARTLHAPELVRARGELVTEIKLYLPARTALVLKRVK